MCGIAGISISESDRRLINSKRLVKDLLLGIEHRGRDATGFAFTDSTGAFQIHKKDQKASDFVKRGLCVPKRAGLVIAHTRAWTQGSPSFNGNNHPILSGPIVGVHNGWFTNDDRLWGEIVDEKRRMAEVDSEVVFAMLAFGTEDSGATWKDSLEAIQGNAALAWMDQERPDHLFLARAAGSPLAVAATPGGSLVFASEGDVIKKALAKQGIEDVDVLHIEEGYMLTICDGEVLSVDEFDAQPAWTTTYGSYKAGKTAPRTYGRTYVSTPGGHLTAWDDDDYEFDLAHYREVSDAAGGAFKSAAESAAVFLAQGTELDAANEDDDSVIEGILEGLEADFWSPSYMSKDYFDPKKDAPFNDTDAYFEAYGEREAMIDAWFRGWKGPEDKMAEVAYNLGAFIRPGDYITTAVGSDEAVVGQVMELPNEFPNGKYVVRLFLGRNGQSVSLSLDTVVVQRHFTEITLTRKRNSPTEKDRIALSTMVGGVGSESKSTSLVIPTGDLSGFASNTMSLDQLAESCAYGWGANSSY